MSQPTFFVQECCFCGRRLEIRVAYLGRTVACQHCRGEFIACDSADGVPRAPHASLLDRAEELLQLAASRRPQPR